jgi:hypothetical protein
MLDIHDPGKYLHPTYVKLALVPNWKPQQPILAALDTALNFILIICPCNSSFL